MDISYSNGLTVKDAVVVVWDDWHTERSGYFRAFWAATPDGTTGSPVVGYCSAGGSHRTIGAVAREVQRYHPGQLVYRNGKAVQL